MAQLIKTAEEHAWSMRFCHGEAARWRRQAGNVRAHAVLPHLSPQAKAAVLESAASCDAQADWWDAGAEADDRWWRARTAQVPAPD